MGQKTLKIIEYDGEIVIKKKPQLSSTVITIFLFLASAIALPFVYNIWERPIAIIIYVSGIILYVFLAISLFFGKIVINKYKKEITIYNPFKRQKKFEDIEEIEMYTGKRNVVEFTFYNGRDCSFHLTSQKQVKELDEFLKKLIPLKEKTEENEDDKQGSSS